MLLSGLSNKEKVWFSNLAVFISADDNFVFDEEVEYLAKYRAELGLEELDASLGFENAIDLFAKNSSDSVKRSVFLELCCMTLCDSHLLPVEKRNLNSIAEILGIEKVEDFTACAKDIVNIRKRISELTGAKPE